MDVIEKLDIKPREAMEAAMKELEAISEKIKGTGIEMPEAVRGVYTSGFMAGAAWMHAETHKRVAEAFDKILLMVASADESVN